MNACRFRPAALALVPWAPLAAAGPEISEFPLPTTGNRPQAITAGPDGNLWCTEVIGHKIVRVTLPLERPAVTTTWPLTAGTVGAALSQKLSGAGGKPAYQWSVNAGELPPGVKLDAAGMLSGTPTAAGAFTFTAQVTDAAKATAARSFTLIVNK